MFTDDQLHQQLFELIYGLLADDEAASLEKRITSEPEVARAYAEAKQQADLLAKAAKLHGPPVELKRPKDAQPNRKSPARAGDALGGWKWLIGLAALALLCVTGYSYFKPNSPLRDRQTADRRQEIADAHLRMVVTAPAQFSAGGPGSLTVATSTIDRRPVAAKIHYALYAPEGDKLLFDNEVETDDQGRAQIHLSPEALVQDARLELTAVRGEEGQPVRMTTRLQVETVRYATQLTTDKPLYRPGETIFYRSLTLTRFGLDADRELPVSLHLEDPAGGIVPGSEQTGYTQRGVTSGQFTVPPHFSGGTYKLVVQSGEDEPAFPEERREVFVRKYRLPRLKKELEFTRDSYAPGDEVIADFLAERAEGGAAADAQLTVTATVDGQQVFGNSPQADAGGSHQITFTLPQEIATGAATLAVVVDDGGNRETIAKSIPINLGKVEVEFYPEGGDLVAGLENRVYFYGHDPLGEPVDIQSGRIVDTDGREIARLATYHEGRGMFRFTPAADQKYRLEISQPAEVKIKGQLPAVNVKRSIVLNTGRGVFAAGQPIEFDILSNKANLPLVVTAACRGTQVAQQEFQTGEVRSVNTDDAAKSHVSLKLAPDVSGVVRLTVYDYSASPPKPLAERLVYCRPKQKLNVVVNEAGTEYSPGEHVTLSLVVTDENGRPRPAALGVSVVDDALLNLADDKSPELPTYFYLASEIEKPKDLEDANFYLLEENQKDKNPEKALDLLLGTQGWRRFVHLEDKLREAADTSPLAALQNEQTDSEAEASIPVDDEDRAAAIQRLIAMEGTQEFPTLYDNLGDIEQKYEADVSENYKEREATVVGIGYVSFFGGAVLLVVLLIMGILQLARDVRFWAPVAVAALVCVVAGGMWMSANVDEQGRLALTGFAGFDASKRVAIRDDVEETATGSDDFSGLDATRMPAPDDAFFGVPLARPEEAAGEGEPDDAAVVDDLIAVDGDVALPALDPQPAAELPPGQPFGGPLPLADDNFDRPVEVQEVHEEVVARHFDPLGPMAEDLKALNIDGWFGDYEGEFGDVFWFDGTVRDVARMRALLKLAMKKGDEKATMKISQAYEKLIAQYQLPLREYAHQHTAGEPGVRSDFAETLLWRPLLIADENGEATVEFDLSDSVTTFVVKADAHGSGRIGSGIGAIISRIPFSLEPKLPLEVNAGDRIELPLAVSNDTAGELPVKLTFTQMGELLSLDGDAERALDLAGGKRSREYFTLDVVGQSGEAQLKFTGLAGPLADGISKRLTVVPPGFPVSQSYSGKIDGEQTIKVTLPDDWVEGSLEVTLSAFPSSLADLQKGMEGMLRDPNGCFEQTSSTNYPNVLALTYMEEHNVADPNFTRRAKDLIERGYDKLVSFECTEGPSDKKAFEWFGGWPAHEALTAYGVLEFRDMQKVYDVDPAMIHRATMWLLSRRNGTGGFERNPQALDTFGGAPDDITDAYIVWALTEAKQHEVLKSAFFTVWPHKLPPNLDAEIEYVVELGITSDDPYIIALAASSAHNAGRADDAAKLMKKLTEHQQEDGHLDAKETSITRSGGISLQIETTALAALAWLKDPAMTAEANKAVEWIIAHRDGSGGFGATQSTIMALKAMIAHAAANKKTVTAGELIVRRDGTEVAKQAFGAGENDAIEIGGLAAQLTPGENELAISLSGDNQMPYALEIRYRTRQPVSDEACPVRLTTKLSSAEATAGDTLQLNVQLENVTEKGQPMTLAVVGLPAGLEPRVAHLEELKDAGVFDYYELNAREIVFYWRGLAPKPADGNDGGDKSAINFDVDVIAEIPGQYTGPASRAYLYYTAEQKDWTEPLSVTIGRK